MFKRRLKALNYLDWDKVNGGDGEHFRKVVAWLEDQKIRHYTIQARQNLRDTGSDEWNDAFAVYLEDLASPVTTRGADQLEWLLGLAVRLEFEDNLQKYEPVREKQRGSGDTAAPAVKSTNPLDNIDFDGDAFKIGVENIAKSLKIAPYPDHLVALNACSKLICERLNSSAVANPTSVVAKGKPYPIMDTELGFNMGDRMLNNGAKALTLLHIQDLRNLQTRINEAIVSVQSITANPKTDTKLGKVGI